MSQVNSATHPDAQLGYDFMGAWFEVHRVLGGGLLEEIYQESMELELMMRQIPFVSKQELAVYYKEHQLKKRSVRDFVVAKHIVVEIKAVESLCVKHEGQLLNYMRITR